MVSLTFEEPFVIGKDVFVAVRFDNGTSLVGRVRAESEFPIRDRSGTTPGSLNLDSSPFWDETYAPVGSHFTHCLLMDCVTHKHGTIQQAFSKLGTLYYDHRQNHEAPLAFDYVCETSRELGLGIFQVPVDAVMTQAYPPIPMTDWKSSLGLSSFESTLYLTAPKPWYALITAFPDRRFRTWKRRCPSFDEIEHQVWTAIGHGAKGLLYWGTVEQIGDSEVGDVNKELRNFLPELRYALPVSLTDVADAKVRCCVLQAGLKELIIVLINRTLAYTNEPMSPTSVEMIREVEVELPVPPGFVPKETPQSGEIQWIPGDRIVRLGIPRLRHVHVTRVELQRDS